jgi:hypothetical protein
MTTWKTSPVAVVAALVTAAAVFALDHVHGVGPATELLYVVPVSLIALWSSPRDPALVILVAAAASLLSLADFVSAFSIGASCPGIAYHGVVLLAIWLTALLSVWRKRKERRTLWIGFSPTQG